MYANFYYQKSTGKYGRGIWQKGDPWKYIPDPLEENPDFVYIGEVHDEELFKDCELKLNS